MLIVPEELVKRINENRGDLSQAEFINFLIDRQINKSAEEPQYATKQEVQSLEQDLKKLLKSFLDFFMNYGMEMGEQTQQIELKSLSKKLGDLSEDEEVSGDVKKATIKWK